ncbi:MAG: hypothetical protein QNJ84_07055 [Alphaproteobacteria bacterium]|nr:hypothetical protein [Alphaproteobacteria bacterium]
MVHILLVKQRFPSGRLGETRNNDRSFFAVFKEAMDKLYRGARAEARRFLSAQALYTGPKALKKLASERRTNAQNRITDRR